jgi:hypothetical protein
MIYPAATTCFVCLNQQVILAVAAACLTLSFSLHSTGFSIHLIKYGIVQPDRFPHSFIIGVIMRIRRSKQHRSVYFKIQGFSYLC